MTLEQILDEMLNYGKPNLIFMVLSGSGVWYSTMEINVTAKGVTFDVRSEMDHKKPINAALECLSRAKQAISQASQIRSI